MKQSFSYRFFPMALACILFLTGMQALKAQTFSNGLVENSDGCSWPWNVLAYNSSNEIFGFYEKNSTYKLVKWNGSSWVSQGSFTAAQVGTAVGRGSGWNASDDVGMAIDGNGNIHVVFRMGATGDCCGQRRGVFYAKSTNNGSTWSFTEIETYSDPNGWKNTDDPAIAIGPNNNPHIVFNYTDSNDPRLYSVRYTAYNGSAWSAVEYAWSQTGASNEVSYTSLDIDSNNKPHVAFQRETNGSGCDGGLWYTNKTGASWSSPVAVQAGAGSCGSSQEAGDFPNLQIGAGNKVYIVSYNYESKIFLSTNASGSWVNTQVNGNVTGSVRQHAFNINGNGDFFIGYNSGTGFSNSDYKFAYKGANDNSWTIGTMHAKGAFTSIASTARSCILTDNKKAMGLMDAVTGSCSNSNNRQLRYASGNLAPCTDTDGDSICDDVDTDDDNDGLTDVEEIACGSNPLNAASTCEICDGIDNDLDSSTDEGFPDTDGDGTADCVDTDDDNDGINDTAELACGSNPLNAASKCEICDGIDNDLDSSIDEGFPDTDGDGMADCVDTDDDNDGVADVNDNAPLNQFVCRDADGDGCDDCSSGTDAPNNDGTDTDGDGLCDSGDPDDDNDGINDTAELACGSDPLNAASTCEICDGLDNDLDNSTDEGFPDTDNDGIADCVDPDDDNDGVADVNDNAPLNQFVCRDADGDGCDDCSSGTDAPNNDGTDTDGDGLCDWGDPDDDNDGINDTAELACGSDPLNAASTCEICDGIDNDLDSSTDEGFTDTDGDGTADCVDTDDDNDGQTDADEIACGSDPLDAGSLSADNDNDSNPDCLDDDDDNDTVLDDVDNCPFDANTDQADSDTDGDGDACDPVFSIDVITGNTIVYIENLVVPGGLSGSLIGKLENALEKYCNGQANQALNKLNAFINQVASLLADGELTPEEAAYLTTAAQNMINAINDGTAECPPSGNKSGSKPNSGIKSTVDIHDLKIFPNPAGNEVNIRWSTSYSEKTVLTVVDQLGRTVLLKTLENGENAFRLDLSSDDAFSSGIYLVRVLVNEEVLTKHLVISK